MLYSSSIIQENYAIEVRNRFHALSIEEDTTLWSFRDSIVQTANKVLPKLPTKGKTKWMTEEILTLMKQRQEITEKDSKEYQDANKL